VHPKTPGRKPETNAKLPEKPAILHFFDNSDEALVFWLSSRRNLHFVVGDRVRLVIGGHMRFVKGMASAMPKCIPKNGGALAPAQLP
jgi:hypothetical protein